MFKLWLGLAALTLTTSASAHPSPRERGEAELTKQLAGLVPGSPVRCVTLDRIDGSTIIDNTAIVYRGLGGTLWVNRTRDPDRLREDDVLVQYVYGSQLCSLDQIRLLDRGSRFDRGLVGLGEFVPYTKPGKAAR